MSALKSKGRLFLLCLLAGCLSARAQWANVGHWTQFPLAGADKGDARAQALVARAYDEGYLGVDCDYERAAHYARLSHGQGCAIGTYQLAVLYESGCGVVGDEQRAKSLFLSALDGLKKLAEAGDPVAQNSLGCMYHSAMGVERDYAEALKWFNRAAEQGNPRGMFQLAVHYASGLGMVADVKKALALDEKAARMGYAPAMVDLAAKHTEGQGVQQDLRKGFELYLEAAKRGEPVGQRWTGWNYQEGRGTDQNDSEAFRWYKKAIDQGDPNALLCLSTLRKAREMYRKRER